MTSSEPTPPPGGLGRVHGHLDHGAVGDQGQVGPLAQHPGLPIGSVLDRQVDLLLGPVAALGLEEDHRVVALDGLAQQRVGVGGRRRRDHLEAGGVAVDGLGALGVVLDGADGPAVGDAADDRHGLGAGRAVPVLGQVADDLVEGRVAEAVELHLGHRPVAAQGQPDADPHDGRLGQRGVHHPLLAEVLEQPVGDAEDPAEGADVLAEQDHPVVGLHGVAQGGVERLAIVICAIASLPQASTWNWASNSSAGATGPEGGRRVGVDVVDQVGQGRVGHALDRGADLGRDPVGLGLDVGAPAPRTTARPAPGTPGSGRSARGPSTCRARRRCGSGSGRRWWCGPRAGR
jgi:hypothetical protein